MIDVNEQTEDWDDPEEELEQGEEHKPLERLRMNIPRGQVPIRIDKFLMITIEGATRNKIQQAIEDGFVLVNDRPIKSNYKIKPADQLVVFDNRRSESFDVIPEEMPLSIAYEDNEMMIINKPPGMVVHPACGNYSGTLVNGLAYYLRKEDDSETLPRVGLVHRIDKDTSGLLVIAKTDEAMSNMSAQFKAHTVHRRYIALVWGDMEDDEGTIVANIGRHQRFRKIMAAYPDGDYGKEAITHYKVLERFNYVTLLELRLETGRTHQIRVHMKMIGHPLFNDSTYGGDTIVKGTVFAKYKQFVENCFKVLPRHALHAKELGLTHPGTGEWIQFNSAIPDDMLDVIDKWRTYTKGMTAQLKESLG